MSDSQLFFLQAVINSRRVRLGMRVKKCHGVPDGVLPLGNAFPMLEAACKDCNGEDKHLIISGLLRLALWGPRKTTIETSSTGRDVPTVDSNLLSADDRG